MTILDGKALAAKKKAQIRARVEELKEKPGKRWEGLVDKIIWAVAAAALGYILAQIGL